MGFEPTTFGLGSRHYTAELLLQVRAAEPHGKILLGVKNKVLNYVKGTRLVCGLINRAAIKNATHLPLRWGVENNNWFLAISPLRMPRRSNLGIQPHEPSRMMWRCPYGLIETQLLTYLYEKTC